MKKYLTKTYVMDNKEAEEFTLISGLNCFCVVFSKKMDKRRLQIPYGEFSYPQFIDKNYIEKEIEERIKKFFKPESNLILLSYSKAEELRIQKIILDNKREFGI